MQSEFHVVLAVVLCAVTIPSVLSMSAARRSSQLQQPLLSSSWHLEEGMMPGPLSRVRRQVLPGSGMPCLTVSFLTDLKDRFESRIDPNKDGRATELEVRQYLKLFNPRVSEDQVTGFIARRDLNGNGQIDFIPEYALDIATPDRTPEAAQEWFSLEDRNRDGYISRQELTTIAQLLGMSPEQAESGVSSYYMSMDVDGDDRLSFDEYKVLYGQ